MKFCAHKNELNQILPIVLKGITTQSSNPILSCINITVKNDRVYFQTSNQENSIQYHIDTLVEEEGVCAIPGKILVNLIKSLPDTVIYFSSHDTIVDISCENTSFSLKTLNALDFPQFPTIDLENTVKIPFSQLSSILKKNIRFASKDSSHPALTGVLFSFEKNELTIIAMDSAKLAFAQIKIEQSFDQKKDVIIPTQFLNDIASLPDTVDDIELSFNENNLLVSYQNALFLQRTIEGNFPNHNRVIPQKSSLQVCINADSLIDSVKRISLIASQSSSINNLIKFEVDSEAQLMTISAAAQEVGFAQETIPVKVEGGSLIFGFNIKYLIDGLNTIDYDEVHLEINKPLEPIIFYNNNKNEALFLVMPVKVI